MRPFSLAAAAALLVAAGATLPPGDGVFTPISSVGTLARSGQPRAVVSDLLATVTAPPPAPAAAVPVSTGRAAPAPRVAQPPSLTVAEIEAVLLGSWLAPAFAVLIAPPPPPPPVVTAPARGGGSSGAPASTYNGGGTGGLDGVLACIRNHESTNNYTATNGIYRGAYQFDYSTWQTVGGSGDPAAASPGEQDHRAALLYQQRGISPWPNARC